LALEALGKLSINSFLKGQAGNEKTGDLMSMTMCYQVEEATLTGSSLASIETWYALFSS
jgi:hypothetical protein